MHTHDYISRVPSEVDIENIDKNPEIYILPVGQNMGQRICNNWNQAGIIEQSNWNVLIFLIYLIEMMFLLKFNECG